MELPLYQKHLIDAMRVGSDMWLDDFGKATYHIKIKRSIKQIDEPTISSLVWRGLIRMDGSHYVLTDLGTNVVITSPDSTRKTLYSN
jgi:hypothetical protein